MPLIAQLSDIHFGTEDREALDAAAACLAETQPDMMVVCGDVTQRGRRREFAAAAEWLSQFDVPKLVVPGNHDPPLLNLAARASAPFARFDRYFADVKDCAAAAGVVAVGLNTARGWQVRRNWAEGSVDLEDLDAAIARAGAADAGLRILACHHPFRSLPDAPLRTRTRRGGRACKRVADSPVDLLLTGHVHTPSSVPRLYPSGGYLAVAAGTLSTRLRAAPPSFNLIRASRDEVRIEACLIEAGRVRKEQLARYTPGAETITR